MKVFWHFERLLNRNRAIAQQALQPERRLARFMPSKLLGCRPVNLIVR
jgi:hypothetical protein